MRILKLALISFIFFSLLIFLMAQLLPSQVRISKAINLAPDDTVTLAHIRDTARWKSWHPAFMQGAPANLRLARVADTDSLVKTVITHASGNSVANTWELHRFGETDSITLQWYMDFRLSRMPWHRFSSLFYEGTYGKMMERGLRNLKEKTGD